MRPRPALDGQITGISAPMHRTKWLRGISCGLKPQLEAYPQLEECRQLEDCPQLEEYPQPEECRQLEDCWQPDDCPLGPVSGRTLAS